MVKVLFFLPWSIIVNTKKKSGYNNFLMKQLYEPFCMSVFNGASIYIGPKDFDIMRVQFNRSMSSSD